MDRREADRRRRIAPHGLGQNLRCAARAAVRARTAAACSSFVTAQICFGVKSGASRATVSRSIVFAPTIFSSCFGVRVRLRGQKRVPRPPASSTAHTFMFLRFGISQIFPAAQDFRGALLTRSEVVGSSGSK